MPHQQHDQTGNRDTSPPKSPHYLPVHLPFSMVRLDRHQFGQDRKPQIRRDGGLGFHTEPEDQCRGHECAPTHARQTNGQPRQGSQTHMSQIDHAKPGKRISGETEEATK